MADIHVYPAFYAKTRINSGITGSEITTKVEW